MKKLLKIITLTLSIPLVVAFNANAEWTGPTTVVSGQWGEQAGEFGVDSDDSASGFPAMFSVSQSGQVVVGDGTNKRVQAFNAEGSLITVITPTGFPTGYQAVMYWPLSLFACNDGFFTERNEYTQLYDFS